MAYLRPLNTCLENMGTPDKKQQKSKNIKRGLKEQFKIETRLTDWWKLWWDRTENTAGLYMRFEGAVLEWKSCSEARQKLHPKSHE